MTLRKGSRAPGFSLPDQDGKIVSLEDFKGEKLAIYFYPQDNTPTCTVQACNIRDNISLLRKHGIHIIGVSADSARKHQNFRKKFRLPFPLLVDTEMTMIQAYGVWGEKTLFGRTCMGIHRTTFLVNDTGKIDSIITKVSSADHTRQILEVWGLL